MFWKVFSNKRKEVQPFTWLEKLQAANRAWGPRISGWLQRKTLTLPPAQLKGYVVLVLLFLGSWNGWIIVQALQHPHRPIPAQQLPLSHPLLPTVRSPVDPSSLAGIRTFRSWLDSLQADTMGRKIYDTILQQRPGLLDSVRQIEKTYSSNH
jgi:hypothetical protein